MCERNGLGIGDKKGEGDRYSFFFWEFKDRFEYNNDIINLLIIIELGVIDK